MQYNGVDSPVQYVNGAVQLVTVFKTFISWMSEGNTSSYTGELTLDNNSFISGDAWFPSQKKRRSLAN